MIHILVHDKKDTVGVAVIEGIKAGPGADRLGDGGRLHHQGERR